jgi:hypothetical protein
MLKFYLAYYLEEISENQSEYLLKNNFELYINEDVNKIRILVKNKEDLKKYLNLYKKMHIIPGYMIEMDDEIFDFDQDNTYYRNEMIKEFYGEDFLFYLLESLVLLQDKIFSEKNRINEIVEELSYDYMLKFNLWNKFGFARLYIEEENEKIGFLDLINMIHSVSKEKEALIKDLTQDKRIKALSKFFLKKELYIS